MMLMTFFGFPRTLMQAMTLATWMLAARRWHRVRQRTRPMVMRSLGWRPAFWILGYIVFVITLPLRTTDCGGPRGAAEVTIMPTPPRGARPRPALGRPRVHGSANPTHIMLIFRRAGSTIRQITDELHIEKVVHTPLVHITIALTMILTSYPKDCRRMNPTPSNGGPRMAADITYARGSM